MFSKLDKPMTVRPEAPDLGARKALACSLIAENVTLTGDLASDGDIQLDGAVQGDLKVAHLTIGESGRVQGAIVADTVEIRGGVTGSIKARVVRLHASARVEGDIAHTQLSIEAGAHFEGRSTAATAEAASQPALSVAAE